MYTGPDAAGNEAAAHSMHSAGFPRSPLVGVSLITLKNTHPDSLPSSLSSEAVDNEDAHTAEQLATASAVLAPPPGPVPLPATSYCAMHSVALRMVASLTCCHHCPTRGLKSCAGEPSAAAANAMRAGRGDSEWSSTDNRRDVRITGASSPPLAIIPAEVAAPTTRKGSANSKPVTVVVVVVAVVVAIGVGVVLAAEHDVVRAIAIPIATINAQAILSEKKYCKTNVALAAWSCGVVAI